MHEEVKEGRRFIGRFEAGHDLPDSLTEFCKIQKLLGAELARERDEITGLPLWKDNPKRKRNG